MADPELEFASLDLATTERFQSLRRELGVTTFGINLLSLEPGQRGRIHAHAVQEEVYLVLQGELTLRIEDVEHTVRQGVLVRVGHAVRRQLINRGPETVKVLALGGSGEHVGRDGHAWQSWDEPGPGRPPQEVPLPEDLVS
jgi:uncharacterized cupin superfamily protein